MTPEQEEFLLEEFLLEGGIGGLPPPREED